MEYKIVAKPTRYRGVVYRSKLEAQWAAFFDRVGWNALYEDLFLRGWYPDFVVKQLNNHNYVPVEVKPFETLKKFHETDTILKILNTLRIEKREDNPVLLLGKQIFNSATSIGPMLGWLGSCNQDFAPARFTCRNGVWGFRHETDEYDIDDVPKAADIMYIWSWVRTRAKFDTVPAHWLQSVESKYAEHKQGSER